MSFQLAIMQMKHFLRVSTLFKFNCRTIAAGAARSANRPRLYMEESDEEQHMETMKKDQLRYDELYYKPSTKEREFTQTWVEFDVEDSATPQEEVKAPKEDASEAIPPEATYRRRPISYMNADVCLGGNWRNLCQISTTGDHSYSHAAHQLHQQKPRGYHVEAPKPNKRVNAPTRSYAESCEPKPSSTLAAETGCLKVFHFSPYGNDRKRLA